MYDLEWWLLWTCFCYYLLLWSLLLYNYVFITSITSLSPVRRQRCFTMQYAVLLVACSDYIVNLCSLCSLCSLGVGPGFWLTGDRRTTCAEGIWNSYQRQNHSEWQLCQPTLNFTWNLSWQRETTGTQSAMHWQCRSYVEARGSNCVLVIWPVILGPTCNTTT